MNILVVGSGGREHALVWKLGQSDQVEQIWVAPGNGGTDKAPIKLSEARVKNAAVDVSNYDALGDFLKEYHIDLTIIGPEQHLAQGIVDVLQEKGHCCFGPTQKAAQIEASKAWAKRFMVQHDVPTAIGKIVSHYDSAQAVLQDLSPPWVIKASGLAAGKGVIIAHDIGQAKTELKKIMQDRVLGDAGNEVVIEQFLEGPEVSVIAFCDGHDFVCMPAVQDHKRIGEGDQGPNTGGMGAYAPTPLLSIEQQKVIENSIIKPTVQGLAKAETPFVGFLYAGLVLTSQGPKVMEFNCRLGDPETQVLMPLLKSDLVSHIVACIEKKLNKENIQWHEASTATVVMAAKGYPGTYARGELISNIRQAEQKYHAIVFHAGTRREGERIYTHGGRVLSVTGKGASIDDAFQQAYGAVDEIHFNDAYFRRDIGHQVRSL